MASTGQVAPAYSDDELVKLMSLIEDADSVELKLTLPDSAQRPAVSCPRH